MKLHEIAGSKFPTNREEVEAACIKYRFENYTIRPNLLVDIDGMFNCFNYLDFENFPVRFGKINGDFYCTHCKYLKTMEGAPTRVLGDFSIYECSSLESLEGAPTYVKYHFNIDGSPLIKSLENFNTKIKTKRFWCTWENIKTGGLGLLLSGAKSLADPKGPFAIINKYIGQGEDGLIECQSELIEAGFEEYAVL